MKNNFMQTNFRHPALRGHGTAHSVLLQMAASEARAARIKALKEGRAGTKWRHLAEFAGVSERAVGDWYGTGSISEDNARKVAEFFDVSFDFVWSGNERDQTPDLFAKQEAPVEVRLDSVEGALAGILAQIQAQLAEQTQVLGEIRQLLRDDRRVTAETQEATQRLLGAVDVANRVLRAEAPRSAAKRAPRAK
jgi:hypothetical protein